MIEVGQQVTGYLTNHLSGRVEFSGAVVERFPSGSGYMVVVTDTDGESWSALESNVISAAYETDSEGQRIVTVKGKRYIAGTVIPARPKVEGVPTWIPEAYLNYWSERDGEIFGPTRNASGSMRPGTVGRAVWDAVN